MPEIPNFWPEGLGAEDTVFTPLAILRAAATQLGEHTQQMVIGVAEQELMFGSKFRLTFLIEVPSLDHYRYKLLTIEHDIDNFYPVTGRAMRRGPIGGIDEELTSPEELQDWLKRVLSSPGTIKLINTLLQQLRS